MSLIYARNALGAAKHVLGTPNRMLKGVRQEKIQMDEKKRKMQAKSARMGGSVVGGEWIPHTRVGE